MKDNTKQKQKQKNRQSVLFEQMFIVIIDLF